MSEQLGDVFYSPGVLPVTKAALKDNGGTRGVDPLPKMGVFKCVRLPDMQSQKRHHNVTSQNDVTRTEHNRLRKAYILRKNLGCSDTGEHYLPKLWGCSNTQNTDGSTPLRGTSPNGLVCA